MELLLQLLGKGQIIWDHFLDPQTDLRVKELGGLAVGGQGLLLGVKWYL